jgi:regulator of nonsense transcripts 3
MSTPAPPVVKPTKSRKERDKERDKERKTSLPQSNERLKTVIRRLPPNLPEDVFWKSVEAWVTDDTVLWKMYYPGKLRKK